MERAVLTRLRHLIPHPDRHIYAYYKEKAFELARRDVISILASKGITEKILDWSNDYLLQRKAKVRFQGNFSDFQVFENGTPQGGILSPFLFNQLIAEVLSLRLPPNTHLFAYADDLQLISTGTTRIVRAQQALDLIVDKCHTLGLKLNPEKNKSSTSQMIPPTSVLIYKDKIEWVTSHKCLGIVFNRQNDSSSQLRHLLGKTKTRIHVLRRLSSSKMGAGFHILRTFYIYAIRSLIVAGHVSKLISRHHPPLLRDRFINLTQPGGPLPKISAWHKDLFRCLDAFNLLPSITSRGIDHPHRGYHAPPPWEPQHVTLTTKSLPLFRARCSQNDFRHLQASIHSIENNEDIATFYTDASVEQSSGRAGAAFMHDGRLHGQRISNDATILQAELFAIRAALHCALRCAKNTLHPH
nr:uncharacterized protein LOC113815226 [Penaeus vannamei]